MALRRSGTLRRKAIAYNLCMRAATLLLTSLLLPAAALAQDVGTPTPATPAVPALAAEAPAGTTLEQRTERIRVEDAGSRVDELRVGGETRHIRVQPKVGNLPAYEVQPTPVEGADGTNGRRVWRAFQF